MVSKEGLMAALFDLLVLAGVISILLLLGVGAITSGTDTRPGFGDEEPRLPEHHDFAGGQF